MKMLVTFALKTEFGPWSARHAFVPYEFENWERRREFDLFKANVGHDEVTVLLTGMGRENANKAMASVPVEHHDVCISAGLAGALEPAFHRGDIVAATISETLQQDSNATSDAILLDLASSCGAKITTASFTSERIVSTALEKEILRQKGGLVEMESAHILTAAQQRGVPAIVVRAISDTADEDLPVDFQRVLDSHGHLKLGGLLKEIGLNINRIPLLIQFGRQSRAAAKSLADFLDRYISVISERYPQLAAERCGEVSAT